MYKPFQYFESRRRQYQQYDGFYRSESQDGNGVRMSLKLTSFHGLIRVVRVEIVRAVVIAEQKRFLIISVVHRKRFIAVLRFARGFVCIRVSDVPYGVENVYGIRLIEQVADYGMIVPVEIAFVKIFACHGISILGILICHYRGRRRDVFFGETVGACELFELPDIFSRVVARAVEERVLRSRSYDCGGYKEYDDGNGEQYRIRQTSLFRIFSVAGGVKFGFGHAGEQFGSDDHKQSENYCGESEHYVI